MGSALNFFTFNEETWFEFVVVEVVEFALDSEVMDEVFAGAEDVVSVGGEGL